MCESKPVLCGGKCICVCITHQYSTLLLCFSCHTNHSAAATLTHQNIRVTYTKHAHHHHPAEQLRAMAHQAAEAPSGMIIASSATPHRTCDHHSTGPLRSRDHLCSPPSATQHAATSSLHLQARVLRTAASGSAVSSGSLTEQIFEKVDKLNEGQAGGAGGRTSYQSFQAVDKAWHDLRNMKVGSRAACGEAGQCMWARGQCVGLRLTLPRVGK